MIDWKKIYLDQVAPVIANFSSPPPFIVLAILAAVFLAGLALLFWAPTKVKLAGAVLIFIVSFVGYMVLSTHFKVRSRPAHFQTGVITKKFSKKSTRKDTRGVIEPVITYFIEMDVSAARNLTQKGPGDSLPDKIGKHNFVVSKSLYDRLKENEQIHGVIMPTAKNAFHFAVKSDGTILE